MCSRVKRRESTWYLCIELVLVCEKRLQHYGDRRILIPTAPGQHGLVHGQSGIIAIHRRAAKLQVTFGNLEGLSRCMTGAPSLLAGKRQGRSINNQTRACHTQAAASERPPAGGYVWIGKADRADPGLTGSSERGERLTCSAVSALRIWRLVAMHYRNSTGPGFASGDASQGGTAAQMREHRFINATNRTEL